jgi:hypothetical protein
MLTTNTKLLSNKENFDDNDVRTVNDDVVNDDNDDIDNLLLFDNILLYEDTIKNNDNNINNINFIFLWIIILIIYNNIILIINIFSLNSAINFNHTAVSCCCC